MTITSDSRPGRAGYAQLIETPGQRLSDLDENVEVSLKRKYVDLSQDTTEAAIPFRIVNQTLSLDDLKNEMDEMKLKLEASHQKTQELEAQLKAQAESADQKTQQLEAQIKAQAEAADHRINRLETEMADLKKKFNSALSLIEQLIPMAKIPE